MFNPFEKVKKDNTVTKSFSYSKGKVTLNFSLRIDIKSEMNDFLECLKVAILEIEQELKK